MSTFENYFTQFDEDIKNNKVVLYMKGTKMFPQCGFSAAVIAALGRCGITEFKDVNILEDQGLREAIKQYSNWPTIPQLYVNGEFIGGCDIVLDMEADGEFAKLFQQ